MKWMIAKRAAVDFNGGFCGLDLFSLNLRIGKVRL
jgi:hypothetical protein